MKLKKWDRWTYQDVIRNVGAYSPLRFECKGPLQNDEDNDVKTESVYRM